jgi:hypothetical protein
MKKILSSIGLTLVVLVSLLALPSVSQAAPHKGGRIVNPGHGITHRAPSAPRTPFTGAGYYFAGGTQTFSGTDFVRGIGANVLITQPFVPNTPNGGGAYDHSLADLVVNETTSGVTGNVMEAFVAVEPNVWGDFKPHLGVCAWHNSVTNGCYTGGANWVDNGANPLNIGADLTADIGTTKALIVRYVTTGCGAASTGWWVQYGSAQVGCYTPAAFSNSGFSTAKFVSANGEYYYNGVNNPGTGNDKPCGDMGNGNAGAIGTGAAYLSSFTIYDASPSTLTASLTLTTPTDSNAYTAAFTSGTTTRSIYYGGAGYKFTAGVASTPGNVGSC